MARADERQSRTVGTATDAGPVTSPARGIVSMVSSMMGMLIEDDLHVVVLFFNLEGVVEREKLGDYLDQCFQHGPGGEALVEVLEIRPRNGLFIEPVSEKTADEPSRPEGRLGAMSRGSWSVIGARSRRRLHFAGKARNWMATPWMVIFTPSAENVSSSMRRSFGHSAYRRSRRQLEVDLVVDRGRLPRRA